MTNGSQVGNADFSFARSVSITFALTLSEQSYFVTRTQAMSIPQTISSVVGSLTGVLSFLGTVLGFVEKFRSAPSGGGSDADQTARHDSSDGDDLNEVATPVKNPTLVATSSMRPQRQATGADPASLGARSDSLYVGVDGPGVELTTPAAVSPRKRRTESVLPRQSSTVLWNASTHESVANMLAASTRRAPARAPDARPAPLASSASSLYSLPPVLAPASPIGARRAANQAPDLQPRHRAILDRFRDAVGGDADF